jgi:hypothetical protein
VKERELQMAVDFAGQSVLKALINNLSRRSRTRAEQVKKLGAKRSPEAKQERAKKAGEMEAYLFVMQEVTRLKHVCGYTDAMRKKMLRANQERAWTGHWQNGDNKDDPTPEEIAKMCERIRDLWTAEEKERRSSVKTVEAETRIVKVMD